MDGNKSVFIANENEEVNGKRRLIRQTKPKKQKTKKQKTSSSVYETRKWGTGEVFCPFMKPKKISQTSPSTRKKTVVDEKKQLNFFFLVIAVVVISKNYT